MLLGAGGGEVEAAAERALGAAAARANGPRCARDGTAEALGVRDLANAPHGQAACSGDADRGWHGPLPLRRHAARRE